MHQGFPRLALLAAPKGERPTSELQPVELPRLVRPKGCFAACDARSIDELSGRTTGRLGYVRQAGFSLCHRRDGRLGAGTTILQLVSSPDDLAKPLPSDYGPAGQPEQGQRRRIRWSRRIVLRDYGPEEAASSRHRAVGTAGPFQGPRADREQRTPPTTPPGPQYLQGTTGRDGSAGWLYRSAPRQVDGTTTRPSGNGQTSQSDAREFGPSFYTPGLGPGSQVTGINNSFYATPAYLTFGAEASEVRITVQDISFLELHLCLK
jgi:hypothetical protein